MVIARPKRPRTPKEAAERVAYEQSFPAAYCTWLETCPLTDGGYGHLLDDCEAHYAAVMEVESVRHDVFNSGYARFCLDALDPASAAYEPCERAPAQPRPARAVLGGDHDARGACRRR